MVVFEAGGKEYEYPQSWKDVTLQQIIDFYKRVEPAKPERAKEIASLKSFVFEVEEADNEQELTYKQEYEEAKQRLHQLEEGLTESEYLTEYLPWKAKYIEHFVEGLDAMQLHPESIEQLFTQLQDIFNQPPPQTQGAAAYCIGFKGKRYFLPPVGMKDSSLSEFIACVQAEDYFQRLSGNDFEALPHLIGILARPKDESFDIKTAQKRAAELFPKLPMDQAWKVRFFLPMLKQNLQKSLEIYTKAVQSESV
jgi:hypothetical protein